ncbi:MAG: hypothetical protein ACP5O6_07670 [Candidatus Baltobacteraceae bacterium]
MRLALTVNGPGETAGWARPLVSALYRSEPKIEIYAFLVPDDFATGYEAGMLRALFPQAHVFEPSRYLAFALGRSLEGVPERVDGVLYLGGDLMHAARLHARLHGKEFTYKFSRARYARKLARAYAVDEANAAQLEAWGVPPERIERVGNLAIDGAIEQAKEPLPPWFERGGLVVLPGSRSYEVEHMIPFFFTAALRIHAERPSLPIAFGISPFTSLDAVQKAIEAGGDPRVWSKKGRLLREGERAWLADASGERRFPIVRESLAAASAGALALTLPGTKCIELAALGVPTIAVTPLNAAELIAINGPLTYLNRIPWLGAALKRAVAVRISRRFRFHTQPNIDAGEELVRELHGTLTPGRVARVAMATYDDHAWRTRVALRTKELYFGHAGAAQRLAESLLVMLREKE